MVGHVVNVKQGFLRGSTTESVAGGTFISFKGIPYAAPPVGDLRFADPQPPQPWTGVRESIEEGSKCAQKDIFTRTIVGKDDCLYLNVATKGLTGSRPVMIWIHGGGFIMGSGDWQTHGPDHLMESDIVYVSINYRLGVLGFLQLDHEAASGNMGLKDQVAALKWVKENISQFGGDPNNVTIFGESAGGASVHYLLVSPLAKGLFHKAIMQSGVLINPFASGPRTTEVAHRFVALLGKDTTDPNEIVEYLRTIPVERLIEVQEAVFSPENQMHIQLPFGPSMDDKSVEPFMPISRDELVAKGFDVPVIIGYCSHEGLLFLMGFINISDVYERLNKNFENMLPRDLVEKAPSKLPEIAAEIRKFYFGDKPISEEQIDEYIECRGDIHFVIGIHKVVEFQLGKKSPTYLYRFSYDSPNVAMKKIFGVTAKGTCHGDDLMYFFHAPIFGENARIVSGSTEDILRKKFIRMWTDFARTGNPTPTIDDLITEKWNPVTRESKNYLEINAELSSGVNLNEEIYEMWKRMYVMAEDE